MSNTLEVDTLGLITAVTGIVVAEGMLPHVYSILGFALGDTLMSHQLPSASDAAGPGLTAQHPWLADLDLRAGDLGGIAATCDRVLAEHGPTVPIRALADVCWERDNAMGSLLDIIARRGTVLTDGSREVTR